jgi:gas vesicle protein
MPDTAYNRVSDAFRSEEDSQILGKVGALLIGVGVGLLIAPAKGEETREPTSPTRSPT